VSLDSSIIGFTEFQDDIERNLHRDLALIPASGEIPCIYLFSNPPSSHEPHSALTWLIQAVYEQWPEQARRILRNRIHYKGIFRPLESGMLKVTAKRVAQHSSLPELFRELGVRTQGFRRMEVCSVGLRGVESPVAVEELEVPRSEPSLVDWVRGQVSHLQEIRRGVPLHLTDRPVVAILVDSQGRVLSQAHNQNRSNKTLHAELQLAQNWWGMHRSPFPEGSRLYVSLKPCKMCAGAIWQMSKAPGSTEVIFLEDDPGSFARETILDEGSLERVRFCDESIHRLAIQRQIQWDWKK